MIFLCKGPSNITATYIAILSLPIIFGLLLFYFYKIGDYEGWVAKILYAIGSIGISFFLAIAGMMCVYMLVDMFTF